MINILLVGGAGYIGSHTAQLLEKNHTQYFIFDNLSTGHADLISEKKLFVGDLAKPQNLEYFFSHHHIDLVMHFASSIAVGESVIDPAKYYRNNVIHTINLLDAMRKHGVKNIIFSSTAAVYGNPIIIPIPVDHPRNPTNPYGNSKKITEDIIIDYAKAYGFRYIFLRYFNAAGADPTGKNGELHEPETHLIPLALKAAISSNTILKIYGTDYPTKDGTCVRDYIHVCDIANAHALAADYLFTEKKSHVFNVGLNVGFSVKEVLQITEKITKKNIAVSYDERRVGDVPVLIADAHDAKKILQWTPEFPELQNIIQHAWNFLKRQ